MRKSLRFCVLRTCLTSVIGNLGRYIFDQIHRERGESLERL